MYPPSAFAVTDPQEIEVMLAAARLGVLVTAGVDGFDATPMPFIFDAAERRLRGHLARPNPQVGRSGGPALVIFPGASAYVSPSLYPSKAVHGRAVPTWNYEALHVHGQARFIEDKAWLRANVAALTDHFEAGRDPAWTLSDAPADYVERMLAAIVGVEIDIERIDARRKMSQNRDAGDQAGVIEGLAGGSAEDAAVAAVMRRLR